MKIRSFLLIVLLGVSFSCSSDEYGDVDAFVHGFYQSFSAQDIGRISRDFFHPNAQAVFGEHVSPLANEEDVRQLFSAILASLAKKQYRRSVIKSMVKTPLGSHFVFVTVLFDREKADGSKIDSMCSSYSVLKTNQGWRFLQWVPSDPLPGGRCS